MGPGGLGRWPTPFYHPNQEVTDRGELGPPEGWNVPLKLIISNPLRQGGPRWHLGLMCKKKRQCSKREEYQARQGGQRTKSTCPWTWSLSVSGMDEIEDAAVGIHELVRTVSS